MFAPSTVIRLLENVDITSDYTNTFSFASASAQASFFIGKTKYSFTDFTYQRKERTVKVKANIETLWNISYMMFQNSNFGSKWFYAFITDMKYLNDETTEISFEIDVMQTWYFEMDIKNCYVEREHVEDDTIGEHLVEEDLNTGQYLIRATDTFLDLNSQSIVVATTYDPNTSSDVVGDVYTGIYSGAKYFAFSRSTAGITALNLFLLDITAAAKADSIVTIFMIPTSLLPSFSDGDAIDAPNAQVLYYNYNKNTSDLDGYTPKNNKLFTYPYNFLYVSTHNGSVAVYRYEYASGSQVEFQAVGNIGPSPVVSLIPRNYKGPVVNFDEILRLADYPLCSWTTDAFTGYLAQNAVSGPLSIASAGVGVAGAAGAVAAGAAAAPVLAAGAAIGVAMSIGKFWEAYIQPNQIKGSISGGANTAIGIQTFAFYPKTITAEYAEMIDQYFDRFGYKVNQLKTPNLTSRTNWNYIRCHEVNIFGNIPNNDLKKIHEIFRKGVTYWHNDNVGNYNRSNDPV